MILPVTQPHIYLVAEDVALLMGLSLCKELIHGNVAKMLLGGSCIIDNTVKDTASEVFIGLDDNVIGMVIKLLCQSPLAQC